ncbi:DUF1641 domain-containing protein [Acidilobus sp. 7A]|uniref:DUF1641 domain-containing protein n=1 Tax=Acidilobus sp. 7A TaxID=1577685 RepID=UPI000764E2C7|nr:DUF1641 domain-containing protein [Acidilobus sp. 7A]AMD31040.1 hypothetical protein SE86_07005 [Acidilobus sp. 7A]
MVSQAERQAEALERLLDMVSMLDNMLSDEELMKAVAKLLITPETLIVIDRLPQIMQLLERMTRPETLNKLQALVEIIDSLDVGALKEATAALASAPQVNSLSDLVLLLGNKETLKGLNALLNIARSFGSLASRPQK